MNADAWFTIGDTHLVCEDFALAAADERRAFAIVCDGCSSSPETDVGARLVALAARSLLQHGQLPDERVAATARRGLRGLSSDPRCLDTTLLVALAEHGRCRVRVFGDGLVLARRRDGALEIYEFTQPDGAPPYPSYASDPERWECWLDRCRNVLTEFRHHEGTRTDHGAPPELVFEATKYSDVSLASDGLGAFVRTSNGRAERVEAPVVAARLLGFKQTTGRFVARRGRRFIRRECPRDHWRPTDDLALATILLDARAA